jgi:23S rRNA (guanosine2251-2'-O)-methyltransferase
MLVFGRHPIAEAIEAGKQFERIFLQKGTKGEITDLIKQSRVNYQEVPIEKLNRLTRKNHQGVVGILSLIEYQKLGHIVPHTFEQGETPLIVVLDGITDVRNMGAIARSAYGAGAHAMVLPERNTAQVNAESMKASAGALNHLPVCRESTLPATCGFLRKSGLTVIAAEVHEKAVLPASIDLTVPLAIVLGDEEHGISPTVRDEAEHIVRLPIVSSLESYNVSVSAGMLLYEVMRQRG